jgi:hypothetical protein
MAASIKPPPVMTTGCQRVQLKGRPRAQNDTAKKSLPFAFFEHNDRLYLKPQPITARSQSIA